MTATALRCAWCEEEFVRPHSRGPIPRYCSHYHRQAAFMARHRGEEPKFVCRFCGQPNGPAR